MIFGPREYIETMIFTKDNQIIQYRAETKKEKERKQVENAYENAQYLGLRTMKITYKGNKKELKEAANIEKDIIDKIVEQGFEHGFEALMKKAGLTDEKIISGLFDQVFSSENIIGKTGKKIIGKAFWIYDKYESIRDLSKRLRDYGDEEIQKFRHFSIYMTANPTVARPFIEDIYCWVTISGGGFTYDNLMEAAMTVSATRGLPYALGLELKQLTEIGLDIVDVIL